MGLALALKPVQTGTQHLDPAANQAAVGFKLGFTRSPQADAPFLAFKMRPSPDKACHQMLQLGKFNLDLPFMAFCPLCKNIKDQAGTVNDAGIKPFFKVALLCRRQGMVEDDHFRTVQMDSLYDFIDLATADIISGIWTGTFSSHSLHGFRSS